MPQLQRKRKITHDSLQPKKRVVLTHVQKRQLCLDSQKTPRLTQQELAAIYQIKERPPYFSQVEEALVLWLTNALAAEVIINGDILREKAKIFAIWGLCNRKTLYVKWDEANSIPLETLEEKRRKLREIIKNYDLNDVFNCDETGLYWDLEPSKTLVQGPLSGKKKSKNRNKIEAYEILQELNKGATPLNIHDTINFSSDSWNFVSQQTISNCWRYTGILPQNDMDELDDETDNDDNQAIRDEMELQDLIDQLLFNDPMNVKEFLHIDDFLKGNKGLTDDEIISMVKSNNEPEIDPNEGPIEIISKREALGHLDNLVVFFEYSSDVSVNPSELSILQKLRH
ncbi:tigger transposable element-derived protein 6-like [Rhizophagus clarus]|uniref:Tigger transposable element-derived protein 6-like n=1 Tax=Rhizophagus clarus TaxID=94130 RepID=A0A8H3LHM2_9GLOM|nr:tigger transposable element-derived protein 6-like [Rhizophagus clarus]